MKLRYAFLITCTVLIIDQLSKIYVKTHFLYNESVDVTRWFKILFIENEGMAWGTVIPGNYGKLILTSFRIFAVAGIGYWLHKSIINDRSKILIIAISLIFAGALGNILDSVLYGVIFNQSTQFQMAILSMDDPYGTWFHGKVVDMFYFPIWHGTLPTWIPNWGGREFTFFNAIFNIADFAISVGVGILIFFNKKAFEVIVDDTVTYSDDVDDIQEKLKKSSGVIQ